MRGAPSPPFTVGDAQTAECRDRFELPGSFAILLSSVALDTGPVARRPSRTPTRRPGPTAPTHDRAHHTQRSRKLSTLAWS